MTTVEAIAVVLAVAAALIAGRSLLAAIRERWLLVLSKENGALRTVSDARLVSDTSRMLLGAAVAWSLIDDFGHPLTVSRAMLMAASLLAFVLAATAFVTRRRLNRASLKKKPPHTPEQHPHRRRDDPPPPQSGGTH